MESEISYAQRAESDIFRPDPAPSLFLFFRFRTNEIPKLMEKPLDVFFLAERLLDFQPIRPSAILCFQVTVS
jgi:hypothetical protein